jgi:hypothetical protein
VQSSSVGPGDRGNGNCQWAKKPVTVTNRDQGCPAAWLGHDHSGPGPGGLTPAL